MRLICIFGGVVGCQTHVERFFKDIATVAVVVELEVAIAAALHWDVVGCTAYDVLSQLCGLVPVECYADAAAPLDGPAFARDILEGATDLARGALKGAFFFSACMFFMFGSQHTGACTV